MATHKLGFLKVNTSDDGLAVRFGDGKIHRFGLGRKNQPAVEGAYDMDAYPEDEGFDETFGADYAGGYSGRFAQPSGGGSGYSAYDDYADDGYDDGYGDDYEDESYDGGYADEGYDDGYADDGYAGDGGYYGDDYGDGYADRYSDEDAGDYGEYGDYGSANPVMRFIDENDWVTYALLFVLPPLGIYLLWRRRRFDPPIRWAISGVSGVWFIILLVLLFSALLSGGGDTTRNAPITMTTPTPTVVADTTPETEVTPEATGSLLDDVLNSGTTTVGNTNTEDGIVPVATVDALAPDATATPLPGYETDTGTLTGDTVLLTATGPYYHNNPSCPNIEEGAAVSRYTVTVAQQRGKVLCPICYPGQENYFATTKGNHYHVDQYCSNMTNAMPITKEAAEEAGKTPCPVCILHSVNSLDTNTLRFAKSSTTDQSGIQVYCTDNGQYFHVNADCTGMKNARSVGLLKAMLNGKTACPTCASAAATKVWFTQGGSRYHNKSDCDGMQGAYQATLAEALILKKAKCTVCWGDAQVGFAGNGETGKTTTNIGANGTVYVYATKDGQYYHTNATCSGMANAQRVALSAALKANRKACPTCASSAETKVYYTAAGTYYHSYATCSGMGNATQATMAQAMAAGKQRCTACWKSTANTTVSNATNSSGTMVYATKEGARYHTNANCSGMTDAVRVDLAVAVKYGKTACGTCASAANRTVYSTDNGKYYHSKADCSEMTNATKRTLQAALLLRQSACPVCIGKKTAAANKAKVANVTEKKTNKTNNGTTAVTNVQKHNLNTATYQAGSSGVKVYASTGDKYYHGYKKHAGAGAKQVSLETALNYNKTACPTCLKVAKSTVYAVNGSRYYHSSRTCAGTGATSVKLTTALANGLDACPVCVTKTKTVKNSQTYKSGASGIKVWATVSGKYYHTSKADAGAGATQVTLETAMNYSKTACPTCASAAKKTVYGSASDKYYHISRTHAGNNASSAQWAVALAKGKKACPVCIGGSEAYEVSDIKYSADADTQVYIDTDSTHLYYHKAPRCSDAGVTGGTGVSLDFVLGWGFKACPYCNPPTSIK